MKRILIALVGMAMVMPSVFAATWHVSPNGNDDNSGATWELAKQTIQAGVNVADEGDTVLVTNGTYVLTQDVTIENGITVKSVNGAGLTIVNGNYPVTTNRCFAVSHTNAILDGLTITGGYTDRGGGVCNFAGTVQNCTIKFNSATNCGGGMCNLTGTVQNCTISGNWADCGGGVQNGGIVQNCTISGNTAYEDGGGVENLMISGGPVVIFSDITNLVLHGGTLCNCTISSNLGFVFGGGVDNGGTVQNCTISGNMSGNGGGVANGANGTVQNCTISGNSAFGRCGGVLNSWGFLSPNPGILQNCTISGNMSANGNVGGVENDGFARVQNCIMYYNQNDDCVILYGNNDSVTYSCAPGLSDQGNSTSGNGNITDDPQFVNSAGGDYRLQASSPCINKGINQDWMKDAVDLDGNPRICDGTVDMGAHEALVGPCTRAYAGNSLAGSAFGGAMINSADKLTLAVELKPAQYAGIKADWWIIALAGSQWYYLNSAIQWIPFDWGHVKCQPVYQGALCYLPETPVFSYKGLPAGHYQFWFAVDPHMDGILNVDGPMLVDSVTVNVQ